MKLEDQVCSIELSKKLLWLGVKRDSVFYYIGKSTLIGGNDLSGYQIRTDLIENECSAFTVSELMEMLPAYIDTKKNEPFNNFYFHLFKRTSKNIQYIVNYECDSRSIGIDGLLSDIILLMHPNIYDEKLADCLAKLLIYLIENGLIKND